MSLANPRPSPRLLPPLIGAIQGAVLYWLYRAGKDKFWPATDLSAFGLIAALAIGVPALIYLSHATGMPAKRRALLLIIMALAYAALGWYGGWVSGRVVFGDGPAHAASVLGAAILGFVLVPLVAGWNPLHRNWDYPRLYDIAWRNAVLCVATGMLTGLFWVVLLAGAFLIKSLGIDALVDLIRKPEFFIPASCIATGEAYALGLSRAELLVSLRRFWMTLTAWFLPLLLCFAVVWVIALPFTGLEPLFATRMAAFFLLWFAVLCITFMNSAWQDGRESAYPPRLQKLVAGLWLTLPVVVAVAGVALWQRIAQYGWTDDRIWAAFVWLLIAGYVTGYALSSLPTFKPLSPLKPLLPSPTGRGAGGEGSSNWMPSVGPTNITVALIGITGLVLLLTPALDPRRISVSDQMQRLHAGLVTPDRFDYNYLRFNAGRWGQYALEDLAKSNQADIASRAKQALAQNAPNSPFGAQALDREVARSRIRVLPEGAQAALDDAFIDKIRDPKADYQERQCLGPERKCIAWVRDMNKDGKEDVLLLSYQNPNDFPTVTIYSGGEEWKRVSTLHGSVRAEKWVAELEMGKVGLEMPKWPDMVVGGEKVRVLGQ